MVNIGNWVGQHLGFDITPGFNLGRAGDGNISPYLAATGTSNVLGTGFLNKSGGSQNSNNNPVAPKPAAPKNKVTTTVNDLHNGSGNGSASDWTPQDQASYNQAVAQAQAALGRIPNQQNIGIANAQDDYNNALKDAQMRLANAKTQYDTGLKTNQQNYRTNENQINQQGRSDQQSTLRMLAAMGAGGGSEAQYLIPQVVGDQVSQQLGGAGQNFAQNSQKLDTSYHTVESDAERQKKSLKDQLGQNINKVKSTALSSKQSLLQKIAELSGNRDKAMGGSGVAAMAPYLNQINSLASKIDSLQRFKPTYTGTVADYVAPELSSFTPAQQAQIQAQASQNASGGAIPYLQLLAGLNKDKKQQQVAV